MSHYQSLTRFSVASGVSPIIIFDGRRRKGLEPTDIGCYVFSVASGVSPIILKSEPTRVGCYGRLMLPASGARAAK
jgi:hypothetical protein